MSVHVVILSVIIVVLMIVSMHVVILDVIIVVLVMMVGVCTEY